MVRITVLSGNGFVSRFSAYLVLGKDAVADSDTGNGFVAVCRFDQGAAVEGAGVGFLKNLVLNILFQMKERSSEKPNTVSDDLLIVGFSTRPTVPNDFQIKIKKYLLTHLQPYLEALDHLALNVVKK